MDVTDLILAIAHHLFIFALVAVIAAEAVLMRPGLTGNALARLARFDGIYGGVAVLVLVVGFLRVFYGEKGSDYYFSNWAFHAKLTAFIVVGLLSIPPTVRIMRWRREASANPGYVVPDTEISRARSFLIAEMAVFILIPIFAAMMARGIGYF
jgi:putative membrane protein